LLIVPTVIVVWLSDLSEAVTVGFIFVMGIIDIKQTGKKLKGISLEHGYTADKLSVKLGFSRATVFKWFAGDTIPRIDTLVILASMFDVKIDDLVVYQKEAI
jgi:Predicted transcriptional regulators